MCVSVCMLTAFIQTLHISIVHRPLNPAVAKAQLDHLDDLAPWDAMLERKNGGF